MTAVQHSVLRPTADAATFGVDDGDGLVACFRTNGFAVLRGLLDGAVLDRLAAECTDAQRRLMAGDLDERHGTTTLIDDAAVGDGAAGDGPAVANYVTYVNELSPAVRDTVTHPTLVALVRSILGADCWLLDDQRFGFVYQDARPGRESAYTRIGWHADWQSGPDLDIWPSVALTVHLDGTGPANGFLRVVPGSQRWDTPTPYRNANDAPVPPGSRSSLGHTSEAPPFEMPLRFEHVPGEVAVYAEPGDVLLHDAYLWHAAARGTDDTARRRHVRGHWCTGEPLRDDDIDAFVKNAAR